MYENKLTKKQGVHYSRYIASWYIAGGDIYDGRFRKWLEAEGCDEDEVNDICIMAVTGKMELQASALPFIKETKKHKKKFLGIFGR